MSGESPFSTYSGYDAAGSDYLRAIQGDSGSPDGGPRMVPTSDQQDTHGAASSSMANAQQQRLSGSDPIASAVPRKAEDFEVRVQRGEAMTRRGRRV